MTETPAQTPVPGSESHADELSTPTEGGSTGEQEGGRIRADSQKVNKEAQYRVQRNQAREELATANARIERMNRREIERIAGEHLAMPGDIFSLSGNQAEDYLTEDGDVDATKVAADVAEILAERPGLRKQMPGYDPTQGYGGRPQPKREATLADLIRTPAHHPY